MKTVRVGVNNNFNCTETEFNQLYKIQASKPNHRFFINSNINTPDLTNANNHPFPIVVTVNPNLTVTIPETILAKLSNLPMNAIDSHEIRINGAAFVRLKWLPDNRPIYELLITLLKAGYKVVITMQRFNSKTSLQKYTSLEHYTFNNSRYRLSGPSLDKLYTIVDALTSLDLPVYICDRNGTGCSGCKLCNKLVFDIDSPTIHTLNLSSSGICPYNCPDCYAKTMQHFAVSMGHKPIVFDNIRQNDKQAGRTKHIKEHKQ